MKVSIITVCFNSEKTIEATIKSVIEQTHEYIEYIIIDGASNDRTIEIVKKNLHFIDFFISEQDKGLYDAMNKGIKTATGDIIGFINSDDLFCDSNAIKKIVKEFQNNKKLDSVYADIFYVSKYNTDKILRKWVSGIQKKFKNGWHPAHPAFYVKREVYEKYGSFNLNFELAADFEIMLRFLEKYKISTYYLQESIIKMRLGGKTNKNIKNVIKQNIECIKAFKANGLKVNPYYYPIVRVAPKLFQFNKM